MLLLGRIPIPRGLLAESKIDVTASILPQKYFIEKIGGDQ
jgi:ABC-type Zn uptake system ZnuABC Zn-binding protein ZnuA